MNYDLLFEKCARHNLDLNWIVYGEKVIHEFTPDIDRETDLDFSGHPLDQRAVKCIETIKSLPWNASTRRKLLENYIEMVQEEELKKQQSASDSGMRDDMSA